MPTGQFATAYGIDRTTLYRWLNNDQHNGSNGLYRKEGSGRPALLQELSKTELRKIVLTSALSPMVLNLICGLLVDYIVSLQKSLILLLPNLLFGDDLLMLE